MTVPFTYYFILRPYAAERDALVRELNQSEEKFREFAEVASDWFWETDADLRFSYFSRELSNHVGYAQDLILGKTHWELPGIDQETPEMLRHIEELKAHRHFSSFRYAMRDDDGEVKWFETSGMARFGKNWEFLGYRGTGRDVTAQARAENAAKEAQSRLLDAIETIDEGFVLYDADDRLKICNRKYLEIYKESADLLVPGARFEDILRAGAERGQYVEAAGRLDEWVAERMESHRKCGDVIEQKLGNGRWLRIAERRTPEGGTVGIRVDITARKILESELRRHRDNLEELVAARTDEIRKMSGRLMAAINALDEGFILVNAEGRVEIANEQMKAFYPRAKDVCRPGVHVSELCRLNYPHLTDDQLAAKIKQFLSAQGEEEVQPDTDRTIEISRSLTPDGGIIGLYTDITDFRDQENLLTKQAKDLSLALAKEKELNELQRQFVSMASHEFRTPLAIIDSAAQRLVRRKDQLTAEDVLGRVEKIRGAVARMANLMESTLSAARMDAGKVTVTVAGCDLRAIIEEVCFRQKDLARNHRIACVFDDAPETIRGDGAAIERIVTNLLSNAVKYSPDSPDIIVTCRREDASAVISVQDFGIGIHASELPQLFTRFYRAKTSTGIAGTGIGLNVVKQLAEAHGGTVGVESARGEGSTFTVRLPIAGPVETTSSNSEAA